MPSEADMVTITASGGPFREWSLERMRAATVEEAVAHPNWAMGRKISLDSATLMNKGLELIEAHFLFALPPEKLGVVVHPQSIVHCLVSYEDGTTMAHLSAPDMRTPIAHALGWPRRIPSPSRRLDLATLGTLVFQPPAHDRFPALNLAIGSMRSGGLAPTVLNAANEIAVQAFLDRRIGFLDISSVVGATLERDFASNGVANDLESVLGTDARARVLAEEICQRVGTVRHMLERCCTAWLAWSPVGIPAFLFYVTLVVFVHELGHFLVARAFGTKVDVFSVGFGGEIFGFTDKRGTRWKLSWLPIGGYVKFAGDADAASTPDREALQSLTRGRTRRHAGVQAAAPARGGGRGRPVRQFPVSIVLLTGLFIISGHRCWHAARSAGGQGQRRRTRPASSRGDAITRIDGDHDRRFLPDGRRSSPSAAAQPLTVELDRARPCH